MKKEDIWKTALGVLLTSIVGLLSYIAVTLKTLPVRIEQLNTASQQETRLREGRDESLQRQISKLSEKNEDLEKQVAKINGKVGL